MKLAGVTALRQGRFAEAEQWLAQALHVGPATAELLFLFGTTLAHTGKLPQAVEFLTAALSAAPNDPAIIANLATALRQSGRADEATRQLKRGLVSNPKSPELLTGMGHVLRAQGDVPRAAECAGLALKLKPDHVEALQLAGLLMFENGRPVAAANYFERALAQKPDPASSLGLARARRALGDVAGALAVLNRALETSPEQPALHVGLAEAEFAAGDYAHGAVEYEWRWHALALPTLPAPLWDGAVLGPDKTLLLWCDGASAEAIQYARFAPYLHGHVGRVILTCPAPLAALLGSAPGIDEVVPAGAALPAFDAHLPLGSLLHRLGVTGETIPAAMPYLAVDPARAEIHTPLLGGREFKIGLCWTSDNGARAPAFADLAPLFEIPGLRFFALDSHTANTDARLTDLSGCLTDLADAGAVLSHLDLVITADSALAHLAGALNRPAWVMLPRDAHWRWGIGRTDSPWYPSLLLHREGDAGWTEVVRDITSALAIYGTAGLPETAEVETFVPPAEEPKTIHAAPTQVAAPVPELEAAPPVDPNRHAIFTPFLAGEGYKIGLALAGETPLLNELEPLFHQSGLRFFALDRRAATQIAHSTLAGQIADLSFAETATADATAIIAQLDLIIGGDNALATLAARLGVPAWVLLPEDAPVPAAARAETTTMFRRAYGAAWNESIEQVVFSLVAALMPARAAG